MIDGVDYERGASVSGNRGYFLKVCIYIGSLFMVHIINLNIIS